MPQACLSQGLTAALPAARVLEARGGEGLPRGRALRQGGHQHPRQRLPGGKVGAVFKVALAAPTWVLGAGQRLPAPVRDPRAFPCRHGWNLTVLPNNTGSILRHLGAVPGKPAVGWRAGDHGAQGVRELRDCLRRERSRV